MKTSEKKLSDNRRDIEELQKHIDEPFERQEELNSLQKELKKIETQLNETSKTKKDDNESEKLRVTKITTKQSANGSIIYYADGQRISKTEAVKIKQIESQAAINYLLEKCADKVGVDIGRSFFELSDEEKKYSIRVDAMLDDVDVINERAYGFANLKDAIIFAREFYKNLDELKDLDYCKFKYIRVGDGNGWNTPFLIKSDGTEESRTIEAKEVVAELEGRTESKTKFSGKGDLKKMFDDSKHLDDAELNSQQKKWVELGNEYGLNIVWLDAHKNLNGAVEGSTIYFNSRNNKNISKTFWHEQFHLISALNPKLHKDLINHFGQSFTTEQLDNYRKQNNREDLTDDETIEEILSDNFDQIQRRVKILQDMSNNPSLLKRFVAFIKNLVDKFISKFHNPEGGMTTKQRDDFIKKFNESVASLKDIHGNKIFTTYKNGKELKFANGEEIKSVPLKFSAKNSVDNSDKNGDNAISNLTDNQKKNLFDVIKRRIDSYVDDQLKKGVRESEIAKELTSENSRHRTKTLGALRANLRDFENRANDREHRRLTVERIHGKKNWTDEKIDKKYSTMIDNLREMVNYGGVLYRELALYRARTQGMSGKGVQLLSWVDAERQRDEREGRTGNRIKDKHSSRGAFYVDKNLPIDTIVPFSELNTQQQAISEFGRKLGTPVIYFKGNSKINGAHLDGVTYINVNAKMSHSWIFWHETFHWIANNNPELYDEVKKFVSKTEKFSKSQIDDYRKEFGRKNLTDEEIIEEMLADSMSDVARRISLFREMGKKNKSLVEKVVAWVRELMDKFRDFMNKPSAGLTREQSNRMVLAFEKLASSIVDENGRKIFKVYPISHRITLSDGKPLTVSETFKGKSTFIEENDDKISEQIFQKYLTDGIMRMVRDKISNEIGKYVELSKMSDPVKRDRARDRLPYIRQMLVQYNQRIIQNNTAYKNRLAVKIEYARRCFDYDRRIEDAAVRQMDGYAGQGGVFKDRRNIISRNAARGNVGSVRRITSGLSRHVSGELSGSHKHFLNLYSQFARNSKIKFSARDTTLTNATATPNRKEIADGYYTESGKSLNESKANEFIVDENGNRNLGEISPAVAKIASDNADFEIKPAPIRLLVGNSYGGYRHILNRHAKQIKSKRFKDAISFVNHTLNNFDKIYKADDKGKRIILHCSNDKSKGFAPIELRLSPSGEYYRVVTAYPNDEYNKNEDLIYDGLPDPSTAATNGVTSLTKSQAASDNKDGIAPVWDNVNKYKSSSESVPQNLNTNNSKIKFSIMDTNDSESKTKIALKNLYKALFSKHPLNERARQRINRLFSDLTGYKVSSGHTSEDVVIDHVQKIIRTREAYDWAKSLPAIGSAVSKQLHLPQSTKMNKYIAEWFLTGAPNNTSAEASTFQRAMRENFDYADKMIEIQLALQNHLNKSAEEMAEERIAFESEKKSVRVALGELKHSLYDDFVEELEPVNRLVKEVEDKTGIKISDSLNPFIALRNYRGMAGRARVMIEGKTQASIDALKALMPNMDFTNFKTLHMILEDIGALNDEKTRRAFSTYLTACSTKELHVKNHENEKKQQLIEDRIDELEEKISNTNKQSEIKKLQDRIAGHQKTLNELKEKIYATPLTEKQCDEIIKNGKTKFGNAQKDIQRYSRMLLDMMYQNGIVGKERYAELLEAWQDHVPMFRAFDENEDLKFGDSLKHMLGSSRDVIDPIQSIIRNTFSFTKRAEMNKARCLLANLARCGGVGELVESVDGQIPHDGTIITYYENGEKKYLQTDIEVAKAVKNLSPPQITWFMRLLRIGSTLLRNFATVFNPNFAFRNAFRDTQDAFIYGGKQNQSVWEDVADIIYAPLYFVRGFMHAWNQDGLFNEWMAAGGAQASFWSVDRDYTQASLDAMTKSRWQRYGSVKGIFEALKAFGEYSELGTRIGQYEKVKDKLAKQRGGKFEYGDLVTAAFESRDLMDFARGGKSSRQWNNAVAFANANIQGWDKFFRTFDPRKVRTKEGRRELGHAVFRIMLTSVLPTLILFMLNHDKDWYKKDLPEWERQSHWIIGENIRIPKGMDLGLRVISNITENYLNWACNKEPMTFEKNLMPLWDALPDILPTGLAPIFEYSANYDSFRKTAIVPMNQQKLPEPLQYNEQTSELAKWIGKNFELSPRKVDHTIFGYTGNFGKYLLKYADMLSGDKPRDWNMTNLPLVGGFVRTPYQTPKLLDDFYSQLDAQTKLHNEYKLTNKKIDGYSEARYKRMVAAQKELQRLNKLERDTLTNKNISGEERNRRQLVLQKKRVAVAEKAMKNF